MTEQEIQELIHKMATGTITPAEKQVLEDWYQANQDHPVEIPAAFAASEADHEKRLLAKIRQQAGLDTPAAPVYRMHRAYRWWAAAAILLLTGTGLYFLSQRMNKPVLATTQNKIPALDQTPVNKTVLTLPDGSKIALDEMANGTIATQGPVTITKQDKQIIYETANNNSAAGYHVLSTARGSEYELVLGDGSQIWLNAASSIRFPAVFSGKERNVDLSGEAWFDVDHADRIPFVVHSNKFTTSVLGTAFDIRDYPGEKDRQVAVQRGRVKVQAAERVLATLTKGQQVKVSADTTVYRQLVDTLAIAGWRQGKLVYADETLEAITADLQRVFNQTIVIKDPALKAVRTAGVFNKQTGLQQVLDILCRITDSHLSKKNGTFIIE